VTFVLGIIMLGVLVFVHELGHFLVAKASGVKVLKFSLGFGPKLVGRKWGDTEYLICAVPLGGYVQMLGEGGGEQGEDAPLTSEEIERSFAHKSVGKRIAIVAAGPLMNLILPFLILPIAYMVGVNIPVYLDAPACADYVVSDSDAARSGLEVGDCIVNIGSEPVTSWQEGNIALISAAGETIEFIVERSGELVELSMQPENNGLDGLMSLGLQPLEQPVIGGLRSGDPADEAGMKTGDRVVEISGTRIVTWFDMKREIQSGQGRLETFVIDREGEKLELKIAPKSKDGEDFLIGVGQYPDVESKHFGFVAAVKKGGEQSVELMELTLVFIKKLFSGDVSSKNIGGPITVVKIAGEAAQTGISVILSMLAFLSIQLGILNLLPIPILDGGHLFFNLIELIIRKPLSIRVREAAQQIGMLLLLSLMALAFYNDIMRLF
jgi:regulator of sigma E protease